MQKKIVKGRVTFPQMRKRPAVQISSAEKYFVIPILAFLILIVSGVIIISLVSYVNKARNENKLPTCGDGSFYNTCSLVEPYYCNEGILVEKASICGCKEGHLKQGDICLSKFYLSQKEITLKYILDGKTKYVSYQTYGGLDKFLQNQSRDISYNSGEKAFRVDFKLEKINEPNQRDLIMPLVVKIQNLARDKETQARIAISLVQNILYGASDKEIQLTDDFSVRYSRYPYEVLSNREGVCGEKSELLGLLLKEIGYGVSLFYFHDENHEAVGISCPARYSFNNTGYCFVETSGPSIITDNEIEYAGGIKLRSSPELMLISGGIALSKNLAEYDDAGTFKKIRRKLEKGDWLTENGKRTLEDLNKKYGLVEIYNA